MERKMEDIKDISIEPLKSSNFVKPLSMTFTQNGRKRIWDLVSVHNSVYIIIFNLDIKKLIFVKQFRPAVYYSTIAEEDRNNIDVSQYPGSNGITLELCAGIVDKSCSLFQIAKEEVLEECGFDAPIESFEKIITSRGGVGVTGGNSTLFYVEVNEKMRVSSGGGLVEEGELIEVVEMSIEECKELLTRDQINSPGGFLFAILWFLQNKADKFS